MKPIDTAHPTAPDRIQTVLDYPFVWLVRVDNINRICACNNAEVLRVAIKSE